MTGRRNYGRQKGLFQSGGGGDQGDHILAHCLVRRAISTELHSRLGQGQSLREAAEGVANLLRAMPGHSGRNRCERRLQAATRALPSRRGLRLGPRAERKFKFLQAAEAFEQQNPISAVRFGGVGHGEGHRLNSLKRQEDRLNNGQNIDRQKAERNLRGLLDVGAYDSGVAAQEEANRHGDSNDAHYPGFRALPNGEADHTTMRDELAERGGRLVYMAFPRVAEALGNPSDVFRKHLNHGGDMDTDPDYDPVNNSV
ncbi:hypothetical protein [Aliagarivorans marinus]|uniref:hypothetical protein n=1 Tax=Aliagarivorans marinus TaxID=561965 RepID=UPI00047BDC71|nr:hypothetical protein [Aliagarivorans marinus]